MKLIIYSVFLALLVSLVFSTECRTIGTRMYLDENNRGYIGCDIKVEGDFNISKSYCVGTESGNKKFLMPDEYGMKDQYYATLSDLERDEEVYFLPLCKNENLECLPHLNTKCIDSDGYNFYESGSVCYSGECFNDYCSTNNLTEYYCFDNLIQKYTYPCDFGCSENKCNLNKQTSAEKINSNPANCNIICKLLGDIKKDFELIKKILDFLF